MISNIVLEKAQRNFDKEHQIVLDRYDRIFCIRSKVCPDCSSDLSMKEIKHMFTWLTGRYKEEYVCKCGFYEIIKVTMD